MQYLAYDPKKDIPLFGFDITNAHPEVASALRECHRCEQEGLHPAALVQVQKVLVKVILLLELFFIISGIRFGCCSQHASLHIFPDAQVHLFLLFPQFRLFELVISSTAFFIHKMLNDLMTSDSKMLCPVCTMRLKRQTEVQCCGTLKVADCFAEKGELIR